MGETVDVLVVAANYGSGRRSGGVSTLVCAVLDDRRRVEDDEELKYSTFVRVGSGFSFADYVWIRQKPWKVWDKKNPPSFLEVAKKGQDDKGDVYLEPEDSFILKIIAAEVISSDQYHMGFTMRFPRALLIRDDLTIADCMTASAVLESMRSEKKRKVEDDDGKVKKKRKTAAKATILPEYQGVDLKEIKKETKLFNGYKFVVMSDPKSKTGEEDKKNLLKLIHSNGGSYAQIVRNQPDIMVVYGGTTMPYDIKMIVNKGKHDIIKPSWILDSIKKGSLVKMSKKYFFHATDSRQASDEYEDESETEDEGEPEPEKEAAPVPSQATSSKTVSTQDEPVAEEDGLSEWFKVAPKDASEEADDSETESETENDSDNEDVLVVPEDAAAEDAEDDDWLKVPEASGSNVQDESMNVDKEDKEEHIEPVKMGEEDTAMEYDQELIFKHLCFYLDSPENARKHDMSVKSKHEADISKSFEELAELITKNGGRILDLDEPKLTHIVFDKRDTSRRAELMKRTSKPKRRNLVVSDFIHACLDEETLLDEEAFAP